MLNLFIELTELVSASLAKIDWDEFSNSRFSGAVAKLVVKLEDPDECINSGSIEWIIFIIFKYFF